MPEIKIIKVLDEAGVARLWHNIRKGHYNKNEVNELVANSGGGNNIYLSSDAPNSPRASDIWLRDSGIVTDDLIFKDGESSDNFEYMVYSDIVDEELIFTQDEE